MITVDPRPDLTPNWPGSTWCRACGLTVPLKNRPAADQRCSKHRNRNPCAIEGCKRTIKAPWEDLGNGGGYPVLKLDQFLCGTHWKAFVPPRSAERRVYDRFFRRAKKYGWTNQSSAAFWRFWNRLVTRARARASGFVNVDEIYKIMGWEKESQ